MQSFNSRRLAGCEEGARIPGMPEPQRMEKGPVAVIECGEEIPCNPCEEACPFGAITVGLPITNLPVLDADKCRGCGLCIPHCPGLAIFKIHLNYTEESSLLVFPYEYYPLPEVGERLPCRDRHGRHLTEGEVLSVDNRPEHDGTVLVTVVVSRKYATQVRSIYKR